MKRDHSDRVTLYLAIESVALTRGDIAKRLGSPPDRGWGIGDVRGKTGKSWECNGWVIETVVRSSDGVYRTASELIPIALDRFEARAGAFRDAIARLDKESVQVYVVLAILAEEVPGIECSHTFLNLLAALGGTFQIDLTVAASE